MNAPEGGSEADSARVPSITIELPEDIAERLAAWPDLVRGALEHVAQQQSNQLRGGALVAVGAECERAAFVFGAV